MRAILIPVASGLPAEFSIDSGLIDGIAEKVSYGHPDAGNNFTAWSCTFWQVKDLKMLGNTIGKHFFTNYVLRHAAKMILENSLKDLKDTTKYTCSDNIMIVPDIKETNNVTAAAVITEKDIVNIDDLPMNLMKIESGTGTPKKKEKKEKSSSAVSKEPPSTTNTVTATVNANNTTVPQVKISSFFARLKKPEGTEKITRISGEYFQPFFVKPNVKLAPHDRLSLLRREKGHVDSCVPETATDFWNSFNASRVRIPFEKQTCLCVGYDGRPVRAVLKLLKFEENYRPAYLGTWRKSVPLGTVSGRRPFSRVPEVDYDYDSDGEWDEGEDPEGESLSDLDDEEEDENDEENDLSEDELEDSCNRSCTGSVDVT